MDQSVKSAAAVTQRLGSPDIGPASRPVRPGSARVAGRVWEAWMPGLPCAQMQVAEQG